jgi:hypothetical protein
MNCWLCGSEFDAARSREGRPLVLPPSVAPDPYGFTCSLCGVTLPASQHLVPLLEKLKQLAQFGLTSNVRLLSEPSRAES